MCVLNVEYYGILYRSRDAVYSVDVMRCNCIGPVEFSLPAFLFFCRCILSFPSRICYLLPFTHTHIQTLTSTTPPPHAHTHTHTHTCPPFYTHQRSTSTVPNKEGWRGTEISVTIAGSWAHYRARVLQYFQQLAVITPYAGTYAKVCLCIHLQLDDNDYNDNNNNNNIYDTRLFICCVYTFVLHCIVIGSFQCRLNFPFCSSFMFFFFFSFSSISLYSSLIQAY